MKTSIGEETLQTHLRAEKIAAHFEREYRFAYPRRWRFDFADPHNMIAVEVEGGTWVKGRHTTGKGFENDCHKYNQAAHLGWRVFRFTTKMVTSGEAIAFIKSLYNTA